MATAASLAASSHFLPRLSSASSFTGNNPFLLPASSCSPSPPPAGSFPSFTASSSCSSSLYYPSLSPSPSSSAYLPAGPSGAERLQSVASLSRLQSSGSDGGMMSGGFPSSELSLSEFGHHTRLDSSTDTSRSSQELQLQHIGMFPSFHAQHQHQLQQQQFQQQQPLHKLACIVPSSSRSVSASSSSSLSLQSPSASSSSHPPHDLFSSTSCHLARENNSDVNSPSWHCSYGCGKVYRKSSGRSIRRHVVSCFRQHWPGGAELSEKELSTLIAAQQDRGLLVTGLRRWRMRQSRRAAHELSESERWRCPWDCGKYYRSTSSRSIQRHATTCPNRSEASRGGRDGAAESAAASVAMQLSDADSDSESTSDTAAEGSGDQRQRKQRQQSHRSVGKKRLKLKVSVAESTSPSSGTQTPSMASSPFLPPAASSSLASGREVDYLYPDSTSSPASTPSSASYASLSQAKQEVALQLRTLVRDLYSRYGTNHPVFSSRMITHETLQTMLSDDAAADDDCRDMGDARGQQQPPAAAPSAAAPPAAAAPATTAGVGSGSLLAWTCECGLSFKITSSKSIQKHRAGCAVHRQSDQQHAEGGRGSRLQTQTVRVKKERDSS